MTEERLNAWEILFQRALQIVDSVAASGTRFDNWSFGGGTVLMRRYRHRVSKDVDIFVPDPQYLGYVSPRLNDTADSLASDYLETAISIKLFFPEGEIDFIAGAPLTDKPIENETIQGRRVRVAKGEKALRTVFSEIDTLEYRPEFDECIETIERVLNES